MGMVEGRRRQGNGKVSKGEGVEQKVKGGEERR